MPKPLDLNNFDTDFPELADIPISMKEKIVIVGNDIAKATETEEFKAWRNATPQVTAEVNDRDGKLLLKSIVESLVPYSDTLFSAFYHVINTFFRFFPKSLAISIAVKTFRKVYKTDPQAAKRLLHDINMPIHLFPKETNPIPQSIMNLHKVIKERLNEELILIEKE